MMKLLALWGRRQFKITDGYVNPEQHRRKVLNLENKSLPEWIVCLVCVQGMVL